MGVERFGWVPRPEESDRIAQAQPISTLAEASWLKDSGKGKVALLYKSLIKVAGKFTLRDQKIGDCVSMGAAMACDVLAAVEIDIRGESERWISETATEPIYAGSRVEIGGGGIFGDGSIGAWAAEWVKQYGVIPRGVYGSIDLTTYSGQRAREWGRRGRGCPDELEPIAKQHPVKAITKVESYEQARDAIYNGYPVTIASNQGFTMSRDSEGFCRARGRWPHQMALCAVDDEYKRPGCLVANSWGDYLQGGSRHDQPPGTFWADADVIDRICRQGDSWAFGSFDGFPSNPVDLSMY